MSTIKANRWAWILAGTVLAGGGLVLAFLLVMATQNSERLEPYFAWLVWGNLAVAAVLGLTIAIALGRLALRLRARKFGSRLLLKLAGIFGLVGLLPGLLIYTVSYQFVSRSIETWFDVRVEGALEAGLNLGRSTLDTLTQDVAAKTRTAALRMAEEPRTSPQPGLLELERLREQIRARTVSVASEGGVAPSDGSRSQRASWVLPSSTAIVPSRSAVNVRISLLYPALFCEPVDAGSRMVRYACSSTKVGSCVSNCRTRSRARS